MAWCGLILEQAKTSIGNKNKCIEDLKNKSKALQAQMDDLNKTHVVTLSGLSKASKEEKNLKAMFSNQEASIQSLTASLDSTRKEIQKRKKRSLPFGKLALTSSSRVLITWRLFSSRISKKEDI